MATLYGESKKKSSDLIILDEVLCYLEQLFSVFVRFNEFFMCRIIYLSLVFFSVDVHEKGKKKKNKNSPTNMCCCACVSKNNESYIADIFNDHEHQAFLLLSIAFSSANGNLRHLAGIYELAPFSSPPEKKTEKSLCTRN